MKKRLNSEKSTELINALGGTQAVATLCEVSKQAVSFWKRTGIPNARLLFLKERYKKLPLIKNLEV